MKAIIMGFLLPLSFLAGMSVSRSDSAGSPYKSVVAKHWQVSKEFTLAVAEAMPAEGYDFKPNPEELSFGQLMFHIAAQNSDSCSDAAGTKPLAEFDSSKMPPATDRPTAIRVLNVAFDKCAREIDGMSAEQWDKEVYKFQGQPVLAHEALWYAFTHTSHHRAQAEVYLRLKKITPPKWRF